MLLVFFWFLNDWDFLAFSPLILRINFVKKRKFKMFPSGLCRMKSMSAGEKAERGIFFLGGGEYYDAINDTRSYSERGHISWNEFAVY